LVFCQGFPFLSLPEPTLTSHFRGSYDTVISAFDQACRHILPKRKKAKKQWISAKSEQLVERRRQTRKRYWNHRNDANKAHWRNLSEQVNQSLTADKDEYINKVCLTAKEAAAKNNYRELYNIVNKLSGKKGAVLQEWHVNVMEIRPRLQKIT